LEVDNCKQSIRLQCFFYFLLGGSAETELPQARETRGTPLLEVSFAFGEVLSCLLLQQDTVGKNAVWNLRRLI